MTDLATENNAEKFEFTAENTDRARSIIDRYPEGWQASAVIPLLDMAQRQNSGHLSQAAMDYVADMLDMPKIRVYEVATFYTMYNHQPVGKHHIQICTNLPCWLRGSDDILAACEDFLNLEINQTSGDKMFTLTEVECLGACVNAPMMQINDDYYEDLDSNSVLDILSQLKMNKEPKTGSQINRVSCEPISGLTTLQNQEELRKAKLGGV